MIDLMPTKEKKELIRAFYLRLTTVLFLVLGVCMLIASIALLPSYFLSIAKENSVNEKLKIEKSEGVYAVNEQTLLQINALDKKLTLLERAEKNKFLVSERVIKQILSRKLSDVKITEISYRVVDTNGQTVTIKGTAPSRERLLLFRMALEQDPSFRQVDLPISNFVKGSNIEFSLNLIPA